MKLNLGCGKPRRHLEGFVNVDSDPENEPDVLLNLVSIDRWPWPDGSVERIESYHLIEHVSLPSARGLLKRCREKLRPGGVLVIECPDLEALCRSFPDDPKRVTRSIYGKQYEGAGMRHRYGYSRQSLSKEMKRAGFEVISVGDGTDYHAAEEPCLRVEGVKP